MPAHLRHLRFFHGLFWPCLAARRLALVPVLVLCCIACHHAHSTLGTPRLVTEQEGQTQPANGILFLESEYLAPHDEHPKLFMSTGFLSDAGIFYTASHCLERKDSTGSFLDWFMVYQHLNRPFGKAGAAAPDYGDSLFGVWLNAGRDHHRFILHGDSTFCSTPPHTDTDWAAVRPPPAALARMQRYPLYAGQPEEGDTVLLYGYTSVREADDGRLYTTRCVLRQVDSTMLYLQGYPMHGFSGGPVLLQKQGRWFVIGLVCTSDFYGLSTGRRITPAMQTQIIRQMNVKAVTQIRD